MCVHANLRPTTQNFPFSVQGFDINMRISPAFFVRPLPGSRHSKLKRGNFVLVGSEISVEYVCRGRGRRASSCSSALSRCVRPVCVLNRFDHALRGLRNRPHSSEIDQATWQLRSAIDLSHLRWRTPTRAGAFRNRLRYMGAPPGFKLVTEADTWEPPGFKLV